MSDPFVLIGVVLGFAFLVFYVVIKFRAKKSASLVDGISLILSGVGLLTGIKVCWLSMADRNVDPINEVSTQIFIGGIALCWVSIQNGAKKFYD